MLSGIWPRGSSSAPGSGNTGIPSGRSPGPRYSALIGICGPGAGLQNTSLARALTARPVSTFAEYALREQDRRQPLASIHGGLIGRPPGVEELHELLSRGIVVPFAVALDDLEQLIGGFSALAARIECGGGIALRQNRFGLFENFRDIRLASGRHACRDLVDESVDLALWHRAHETVGGLAVDEGDHGRDRLDAHLARNGRMLVDVHLDQLDLALCGADRLFENRR